MKLQKVDYKKFECENQGILKIIALHNYAMKSWKVTWGYSLSKEVKAILASLPSFKENEISKEQYEAVQLPKDMTLEKISLSTSQSDEFLPISLKLHMPEYEGNPIRNKYFRFNLPKNMEYGIGLFNGKLYYYRVGIDIQHAFSPYRRGNPIRPIWEALGIVSVYQIKVPGVFVRLPVGLIQNEYGIWTLKWHLVYVGGNHKE
jgi:hypothetical protein